MTATLARPATRLEVARYEARAKHAAFCRHIARCSRCVGVLCPTGLRLQRDADAAGWRYDDVKRREAR